MSVISMGGARGEVWSIYTAKAGAWAWVILETRSQPFTILTRDLRKVRR